MDKEQQEARWRRLASLRDSGLTYAEIAVLVGLSRARVHQIVTGYDQILGAYQSQTALARQRGTLLQAAGGRCQGCNKEADLIIHHRDQNCANNERRNLLVICRACHVLLHQDALQNGRGNRPNKSPRLEATLRNALSQMGGRATTAKLADHTGRSPKGVATVLGQMPDVRFLGRVPRWGARWELQPPPH